MAVQKSGIQARMIRQYEKHICIAMKKRNHYTGNEIKSPVYLAFPTAYTFEKMNLCVSTPLCIAILMKKCHECISSSECCNIEL